MLAASGEEDLCFRYGGEEFGILMQRETSDEMYAMAEQLRQDVCSLRLTSMPPITISIGISSFHKQDNSPTSVIERADTALYESKSKGKNRTTMG
ncbi:putative diguanylate cyclase YdaM [compost metagenome]